MLVEWMNAIACTNEHICPWPEKMASLFPRYRIYESSLEGISMSKVIVTADQLSELFARPSVLPSHPLPRCWCRQSIPSSHWPCVETPFPTALFSQMWTSLRVASRFYLMWPW